jgi:hypothetical protein
MVKADFSPIFEILTLVEMEEQLDELEQRRD